ncbi:MAG TPA: PAS domain-containing protein [Myxococcales bacterium]
MPKVDFRALLDSSPNNYMVLDRDLRFVWANRAYLATTASRLEDLVGRHITDAFPNDPGDPRNASARLLRESFERVLATGEPDAIALIPYRVQREPGGSLEERMWSATHTPIADESGKLAFILQHTVDVTELERLRSAAPADVGVGVLRRAEQVQQAWQARDREIRDLRGLFDQAPGFICFLRGPEHVYELANAAYSQLVGHRDLIGKPIRRALPELVDQGFFDLLDDVTRSRRPFVGRGVEVKLMKEPGAPLETSYVDFVYQPIEGDDGEAIGIFVQGHDITQQKLAEKERAMLLEREQAARAEAERANRLKDDFLATVSHELRTPLSAILGWVQMLRRPEPPEERRRRGLEVIERNARAQAAIIEDILDVTRILSGKLHVSREPVELSAVVEAAVESVRVGAESKGLRIDFAACPRVAVAGDAARLQQIAVNLLSNAVKFTPSGGRVGVVVEQIGGEALLNVSDTGPGIAADFLPHVFERFRQAETGFARTHGGLGLGLAIVKYLVEVHGGSVSAHSDGLGRGASFSVRLPAISSSRREALPEAPAPLPAPATLSGVRVLVVDDDPDMRELLRDLLTGCGAQVETAASAARAIESVQSSRPDIVLTDIGMPHEDGYSLVRKLAKDLPAVALTAYARGEDREQALRAGFRAHVAKPVDVAELLAVMAALAPRRTMSHAPVQR